MMPSFLITFREVMEATLVIATILGILVKLNQKRGVKTVWLATAAATFLSVLLLGVSSIFGLEIQKIYTGKLEQFTEGTLLIISALFITWAVFFLHNYFSQYKVKLLQKLKNTVEKEEQKGLFLLVFTAVFREGFEVVLFLSTIYFSSNPVRIFQGFSAGIIGGLIISAALFTATLKLPIRYAFKTTSLLLIFFAGGMIAKGINEFAQSGLLPFLMKVSVPFFPANTFVADIIKAVFGLSKHMDLAQLIPYAAYVLIMGWYVFLRKRRTIVAKQDDHT